MCNKRSFQKKYMVFLCMCEKEEKSQNYCLLFSLFVIAIIMIIIVVNVYFHRKSGNNNRKMNGLYVSIVFLITLPRVLHYKTTKLFFLFPCFSSCYCCYYYIILFLCVYVLCSNKIFFCSWLSFLEKQAQKRSHLNKQGKK